ncbi:MAG: hypothetical protein KDE27_27710 [Planctomycetes bacterium]|nr:hypothetical protein [Planctomycetota bacterium]
MDTLSREQRTGAIAPSEGSPSPTPFRLLVAGIWIAAAACSGGGGDGPVGAEPAGGFTKADTAVDSAGGRMDFANSEVVFADATLDPSGRSTAIWIDGVPSGGAVMTSDRDPGGDWSTPKRIATALGTANTGPLSLAKDSSGNAVAVWGAVDGLLGRTVVLSARRPVGGEWSEVQRISGEWPASAPVCALADDGEVLAAWREETTPSQSNSTPIVTVRTGRDGAWDAALALGAGELAPEGSLGMASDGTGFLLWDADAGGFTVERLSGGQRVSAPVASGVSEITEVSLAVGSDGSALLATDTLVGPGSHAIQVQRYAPGSGWSTPEVLQLISAREAAYYIRAKLMPQGRAVVCWAALASGTGSSSQVLVEAAIDRGNGFATPAAITTWNVDPGQLPWSRLSIGADEDGAITLVWGEGTVYSASLFVTRLDWNAANWLPLEAVASSASLLFPLEDVRVSCGLGTAVLLWVERTAASGSLRSSDLHFRMLPQP